MKSWQVLRGVPVTLLVVPLLIMEGALLRSAQTPQVGHNPLSRHYREGEKLTYHMKGVNEQWQYEIQADGVVKKDSTGTFVEEYQWSNLISNHEPVALSSANGNFRQLLTLDPNRPPSIPNLSQVDPRLIGPMLDFMNFYADLWLAERSRQLLRAGDHFYFHHGTPNSWADGTHVLTGEDSIDFDFTLKEIMRSAQTATLVIHHVPPQKPQIKLPADWMSKPVADTPNNWVQVERAHNGKFLAAIGKETFDVVITLSLEDGKILSGSLDNPVETIERECEDAALSRCGESRPHFIRRQVEISLER